MSAGAALVTGACSGIGRSITRVLASKGHPVVMVSHREGPLFAEADALSAQGARVTPIVIDLARPEAANELFEATQARAIEVDLLVNNAGMFFFGEAADASVARANQLLQLHVVTPSLLTTLVTRGMKARRRGRVMMVSSLSAWRDFPGIAYYGSSKKYLWGFSRSIRSELSPYGVTVTCLMPGAAATGLYDPNVVPVDLAKRLGIMADPDDIAREGVAAMLRGDAECMPGAFNKVAARVAAALPQATIDWIRRRAPWLEMPRE